MIQCPKCSAENLPESRFCSSCGQELSSVSQMPTMEAPEQESPPAPVQSPHVGRIISSESVPAGGFTPGAILADRYRVIGLLGRGGMGEVYRADDLKLGQPVALKFLPPKLSEDPVRRERFFAEVRITRQLSHPNICRVYDIGEVDGRHFLSMEYIDGEDLASLMKRIGALTNEKALDIARQLVAGLSVAHERGVLHRDLKPANIMLDGHGRVRITDFGLAIAVKDESQALEIAGTPAYMAPEQLAGKGATVRSDIYSLGLILYEIYTGKKAFTAKTLAELREQKETQISRAPSEIREGMDPVVEWVIQRCMEKDPNARPASVAQLTQALPGGDPLAAAIAAGETPSPEMVAASGSKEELRPVIALGLLGIIVVGMLAIMMMNNRVQLLRRIPFDNHPEALVELSRQFLQKAGYSAESAYSAHGFVKNEDLLRYIEDTDATIDRWKKVDAKAILFWYRQSPSPLRANIQFMDYIPLSPDNPPLRGSGEILLVLDSEGRLISFRAIPPLKRSPNGNLAEADWTIFFNEAGLDPSQWTPTDAEFNPLSHADTVAAWKGSLQNFPGTPVRIEASSLQGKVTEFRLIGPWNEREQTMQPTMSERVFGVGVLSIGFLTIVGGIFFARRNLRLGRGDRRSAMRLAFFILILGFLAWIFIVSQISIMSPLVIPYWAVMVWIFYMALEPFVRRRWPQVLVAWTRLLSGRWRDPLIARDVLIGCGSIVLVRCVDFFAQYLLPVGLGYSESSQPLASTLDILAGPSFFISVLFSFIRERIVLGLGLLCLLFIMKVLLKNQVAAIIACVLLFSLMMGPGNLWSFLVTLVLTPIFFIVLMRFGALAAIFALFVDAVIREMPAFMAPSAWYSGYGYAALIIVGVIVLYAFYTSLGGRPVFGTPQLDE